VLRRERIRVPAGSFDCILVKPELRSEGIFDQKGELKAISGSSLIRKMFEEGIELRKIHGDEVLDFTLGNPTLEPPRQMVEALQNITQNPPANLHYYMPNAGHVSTRKAVGEALSQWHGVSITSDQVVMTVGAAGALVTLFKTLVEPGDEVILLAPYFAEYFAYMSHFGAKGVVCYHDANLDPDLGCFERIISPRTRAVLLNSPNNPTGHIYSEATLRGIAQLLEKHNKDRQRPILVLCDEPYRRLVYRGFTCPSMMPIYPYTIIASSFSKDLSVPGERIGFIAVHPSIYSPTVMQGLATSLRQLGYVNAPSIMQLAAERAVNATIDMNWYQERRDMIYRAVIDAGLECVEPQGAFYVFVKVPAGYLEADFVALLKKHLILGVGGTAFGSPGFFRLAFCCPIAQIQKLIPRLRLIMDEARAALATRKVGYQRPPVEDC